MGEVIPFRRRAFSALVRERLLECCKFNAAAYQPPMPRGLIALGVNAKGEPVSFPMRANHDGTFTSEALPEATEVRCYWDGERVVEL